MTNSNLFKNKEIQFDLKEHTLKSEGTEVCAPNFKLNMWIKETFRLLNMGQSYLTNLKFKNVCFKNSKISKLVLHPKTANSDIALRLPFYQAYVRSATDKNPSIYFHKSGAISHFSGLKFSQFMEMYYVCSGKISYSHRFNCEEGPYINHDTKIKNPLKIEFDEKEKPVGYFKR